MIVDSHAHLTCDPLFEDIDGILIRAQETGVEHIFNICTDKITLERGLLLKKKYPWIYNVGATTPHDVEEEGEKYFSLFEKAAREKELVAIGETGLDYHYEHSPKQLQKEFLVKYFALALELELPVVIHCRDAFEDLFAIADTHYKKSTLLLHCYTGSLEEAKKGLDRGWMISFSGIVTFKKSDALREVAKYVPIDRIVVETDSPYLAPLSKRGKQNEPTFVSETIQHIADLRGIQFDEMAAAASKNTLRFFQI